MCICIKLYSPLPFSYSAVANTAASDPCAGLADGTVIEPACRTYTECQGGVSNEIECDANQAFDSSSESCNNINSVPAPCGYWRDCSGMADQRYTDIDYLGCGAYYTCHNGYYYSFNFCPSGKVSLDWIGGRGFPGYRTTSFIGIVLYSNITT